MTQEEIDSLITHGSFPGEDKQKELIETHISWVILGESFVYKIKKPVQYSFLDFSTPEKRKYFCHREIELNQRLTDHIYLDVQEIVRQNESFQIGGDGVVTDYAVRMHKINRDLQMDAMLRQNKVTRAHVKELARKMASFHRYTEIVYRKDYLDIKEKYEDLRTQVDFLSGSLADEPVKRLCDCLDQSLSWMDAHRDLLLERSSEGMFRDCHGDLHSRNIFLLPEPQPFDCLEFNDDFRQVDILNEVAFLCMDLDAFDRPDLSAGFLDCYHECFPCIKSEKEIKLFNYYKSYRANVRAKVNSLRARSAASDANRKKAFDEASKYISLMERYIKAAQ